MVNSNRTLGDKYTEDTLQHDSTIRQWWGEFLAGGSLLEDEERGRQPCNSITALTLMQRCNTYLDHLGYYVEK